MVDKLKTNIQDFLTGGGEMGERIRNYDWSKTSLGSPDNWPNSLKTIIRIMLTSQQPIWIGWGKELIKFYNDPYIAIVGGKHPWALGTPASVVWKDIWEAVGPRLSRVMEKNEGTYDESLLLIMERYGYQEETYYTFSYSPVPDDKGNIGGIFCANTDDTQRIIGERQLDLLRILSSNTVNEKEIDDLYGVIAKSLQTNLWDLPFSFLYILDIDGLTLRLKGSSGIKSDLLKDLTEMNIHQNQFIDFEPVLKNKEILVLQDQLKLEAHLLEGKWDKAPHEAVVIPLFLAGNKTAILVVGLNPYRKFDDGYESFIRLTAGQIEASIANCLAYEEEKKRAEALAELDKAKTVFFSNVSHELRTPLTLILGPIEEQMNDSATSAKSRDRMSIAYKNSLRLLKLVNSLLDFSRIEAGKIQAQFRKTDVIKSMLELSKAFQSSIESAGIYYRLSIGEIKDDVYLDPTMWERIVFNLLSNAFKYTLKGSIEVSLSEVDKHLQLEVSDTGSGIPESEIPKLFSRFHRVENVKGRTHEGTGIGLAMAYELVRLHGGTIKVQSEVGKGSVFTVAIPVGKEHLPEDRIVAEDSNENITLNSLPDIYEELGIFTAREDGGTSVKVFSESGKDKILIADDNELMRQYLNQLLETKYDVTTVKNGEEAFQVLNHVKPDLVLSDIMMPVLDGIGLLNKIRTDERFKTIPVVLISARAGEEAKLEGIEAGADDYLVKPFSSKELLSRINSNIRISKQRTDAERNLRNLFEQVDVAICILRGADYVIELANEKALQIWGKTEVQVMNKPALAAFPELINQGFNRILDDVYKNGTSFQAKEMPVLLIRNGVEETIYVNFVYDPLKDDRNEIVGIIGVGIDVTELVKAKNILVENAKELELKNAELTRTNNDLDNFVYTASHDLKSPISNLEGLFSALLEVINVNEEVEEITALINRSFDRFKLTIQDLTDIAKVQKGGKEDVETVDIESVLKDVMLELQDKTSSNEIKLETCFAVPQIRFSRKNIRSIFYNFISNSIKYADPDRTPMIRIDNEMRENFILFSFEDNGLGIPQKHQKNIFQMFKRFHDHVEGSGIGLYIIKRIIDNAGGKIEVESEVGKGSKFKVFLPVQ